MQLVSFRVQKFRNIQDSGEVVLKDHLTCIVGKNQSGKTSLLRALYKFNPHEPNPYSLRREWPRGQRNTRTAKQVVCTVTFELDDDEQQTLGELSDATMKATQVVVTKNYAGEFEIAFPNDATLFPDTLHPTAIDRISAKLPRPTDEASPGMRSAASECREEVVRLAKEGRISDLAGIKEAHAAKLTEAVAQANQDPARPAEHPTDTQFVAEFTAKLDEVEAALTEEPTMHARALDYVVGRIPTFIYMDDYRSFRGRANLEALKETKENPKLNLSEEDETLLMILRLSGLHLDSLIKQGDSESADVLHDRQQDLQDAQETLTENVASRWGQNPYRVQFRVDGQTFFTDIEETDKSVGMIPLEEQSKGFQWFFSFDLHFMHDSDGTFEGCVLLLDEPGLHLHPGAQEDLLKRLDAYALKNTLIYTTHLPFLVDLREPSRIKVIKQTDAGAVVSEDLGGTGEDEKLTLQAALGMRANQSYLVAKRNLVVEGVDDYWIVTELSNLFARNQKPALPEDVMITAAGSASEVVHTSVFMIGQGLEAVALFDSDDAGRTAESKLKTQWLTRYKAASAETLLLGDAVEHGKGDFMIEDLFPDDYYLEHVRESHATKLKAVGHEPEEIILSGNDPILRRVKRAFEPLGVEFNKGSVAKRIRADLLRSKNKGKLPEGVEEKAGRLIGAIRRAFGES